MKNLSAGDVMQSRLITVSEDQDVWSVSWTLVQNRITGAPVLDARGRVVGVISQTDLARYLWNRASDSVYPGTAPAPATAGQLMTRKLVRAAVTTPVEDLARLMLRRRVHRVLITQRGRLIGLVTTMDMLKLRPGRPAARRGRRVS